MYKKNILLLILSFVVVISFAQKQVIEGKVVAFKGSGLNNVNVYAKKAKTEVVTDSSGKYTIECNSKDAIVFKARGFYPQTIRVKSATELSVNMIYMNNSNAYKDALAHEHISQTRLDYCIESLMDDNNNFDKMSSIFQIIQSVNSSAQFASINGVQKVILNTRGPNSLQSGHEALLVVDGIVTEDIANISPEQVKSINVLIANDAAHWGVRGSNGVVEITLKAGL